MNKKIGLVCLLSLVFCGCSCSNASGVEDMNIFDLNEYNDNLKDDYDYLKMQYDTLMDKTQGKTPKEIIEIMNTLNNEVVKSNVLVSHRVEIVIDGRVYEELFTGSGSVIKETINKYYVLTNNHVIHTPENGSNSRYSVEDYLNNVYSCTLEYNNSNYDMAILSFEKKSSNLRVAPIAVNDPKVRENVISIGQPLGKRNSITFGEITKYAPIVCGDSCSNEGSNIKYDCLYYDAFTNNGNSGGMLINYNYEIVGITTFGMKNNQKYESGAGSSASKIREFLNLFETEAGGFDE